MSESNVELNRRIVEAFNARDVEAVIALCHPSIELHATLVGGVYYGHSGVRSWYRDFEDAWGDDIRLEAEAYFELGEHSVAFYAYHGRGRQSGVEVAMTNAVTARWRDGLLVYFKPYADREEALRDLGVSEDELERIDP
jgi:ketosteroid isomerase-like protein